MKQKVYILGLVSILFIFTGIILKVNHWAGAGIMFTAGFITLILLFVPAALMNHYKSEESERNKLLYIVTLITCFVVFTSMLFKIQHWPYAGIFILIALPFPFVVYLPVFLIVTSRNKNFNIYNVVFVLFLLALNSVMSVLLAFNVSKTMIDDSYNYSRSYNKLEKVLTNLPDPKYQSPVDKKIDEVLKIVNDYQEIILKSEGSSREMWTTDPGNLRRPDAVAVAAKALLNSGDSPVGTRLETALKQLIITMENTKGYEALAGVAPRIFNFNTMADADYDWGESTFLLNNLAWALIYLDGLKTNLLMIRASAPAAN